MNDSTSLERIRTICLFILASGVVILALYYLSSALVPFVIAAFFHFSLAPLVNWQRRRFKLPGWLAVATTALLGLIAFALVWTVIGASVAQVAANAGDYSERIKTLAERALKWAPLDTLGLSEESVRAAIDQLPQDAAAKYLPGTVATLVEVFSQGALVFLFLMFMLAGKAVGSAKGPDFLEKVELSIQRYVLAKFAMSALTGLLTWLILALLGVEFALVFGVLAFMLNFIPNIGSVIANLLPVPVVLLGDYSTVTIILAIALPAGVQFTVGNIVEPKVMGKSLGIHPVVVILTLVLFGLLWGVPGMFLATPLTAVLKIVLQQREFTRPIAKLLEGDLRVLGSAEEQAAAAA
ncbi:MAG: AI-2E family transporter [Planctomycetes bacterium]|nr:AI-2E family transporter [Planctomycetota bacterium]